MSILNEIVRYKKQEVARSKTNISVKALEQSEFFHKQITSLTDSLQASNTGIIAEFKRKSPSLGWIKEGAQVLPICTGYLRNGAAALSILTDQPSFGGREEDVRIAAHFCKTPILRKDFIVDEYQIVEARAMGADVILLIAACLDKKTVHRFAKFAESLGLEVLLEIHEEEEFDMLSESVDIVGINNRDLKKFTVDTTISFRLGEMIPNSFLKISESGLKEPDTLIQLRKAGFKGFLMGERFMKEEDPSGALAAFFQNLLKKTSGV